MKYLTFSSLLWPIFAGFIIRNQKQSAISLRFLLRQPSLRDSRTLSYELIQKYYKFSANYYFPNE